MLAQHERPTTPPHAVSQLDGSSPAAQLTRPEAVKGEVDTETATTAGRERRVRRVRPPHPARLYSHRVGDGDVEALAVMLSLAEEIDGAIAEAVTGLRACGYSWAEIGARLGITRQAAQQLRWGSGARMTAKLDHRAISGN